MKEEKEIREQIEKIIKSYNHVLTIPPASIVINAPRALMQITARSTLDALYWCLGERRPHFACDEFDKLDQ